MNRRVLTQAEAEFQQLLVRSLEQEQQRLGAANGARQREVPRRGEISVVANHQVSDEEGDKT